MIIEAIAILIIILFAACLVRKCLPDTNIDLSTLGRWAVITGATDGIGKAFAHAVAEKGFNVFLVSRNLEKLESTSNELREKYGVTTEIFQADFSEINKKTNASMKEKLQSLEVGLLINNVGTTSPHPEHFLELEKNHEELYEEIINVNITSAVNMTRYVLPGMLKAKNGLIINVSSMLSVLPAPLHAMYGGSKSFLTKFSKDLDLEVRHKGVHVHVLITGLVATKLSGASVSDWFPPSVSPEDYAKSALSEATRKRITSGHVSHNILLFLGQIVHPWLMEKFFHALMIHRRKTTIKDCSQCNPSKFD